MATIDKKTAEELVVKVKGQKRPVYFCILKYWNVFSNIYNYAYCKSIGDLASALSSPAVEEIEVLWKNEKTKMGQEFWGNPREGVMKFLEANPGFGEVDMRKISDLCGTETGCAECGGELCTEDEMLLRVCVACQGLIPPSDEDWDE